MKDIKENRTDDKQKKSSILISPDMLDRAIVNAKAKKVRAFNKKYGIWKGDGIMVYLTILVIVMLVSTLGGMYLQSKYHILDDMDK